MMFGFDESIVYTPSPAQIFKRKAQNMVNFIDNSKQHNKAYGDGVKKLYSDLENTYNALSLMEQSKVGPMWQAIGMCAMTNIPNSIMLGDIGASSVELWTRSLRTNLITIIGNLS